MRPLTLACLLLVAATACRSASRTPEPTPEPATTQLEQLMHGIALEFQFYDADGDGRLSFTEWFRTRLSRRPDGTTIFTQADVDGDGFLTKPEIRAWAQQVVGQD